MIVFSTLSLDDLSKTWFLECACALSQLHFAIYECSAAKSSSRLRRGSALRMLHGEVLFPLLAAKYSFRASRPAKTGGRMAMLQRGVGNSLRYLRLDDCAFHPTAELGPLRNLTSLDMRRVHISGDELEGFLSNSPALEQLSLRECKEIKCLRIPCVLQELRFLDVSYCPKLRVVESKAQNLTSFVFKGCPVKKLSLGETLQMKNLSLHRANLLSYARKELPSSMPNLETLAVRSHDERANTPMLPTKFLLLKRLTIYLNGGWTSSASYDHFSLVSFLDASPSLETLLLDVSQERMKHESAYGGFSQFRQITERHHSNLKNVKIIGFNSAKSLVELACYILKNAKSLDSFTLDTTYGTPRCDLENYGPCDPMNEDVLIESLRAVAVIRTYIEDKVPSTVKLTVVEQCSRCHDLDRFNV